MLDTIQSILIFVGGICAVISLYSRWQTHGPLTGTRKQQIKCFLEHHDWRLFAFVTDPAWRLIWRCHWCHAETLTPNTHEGRVEVDAALPPLSNTATTGKTVRL